jgi:DNA-binding NarL/FixJ family response regulator
MIRLLLIDDQDLIRRGMKALLKTEPDFALLGEAVDGQQAIDLLRSIAETAQLPHVILMDVRMPVMDGVAATREIGQQFPDVKILILTTFDDQEYVQQALQYGASGYLLKNTPFEELAQAIRFVAKGYTHLGPGLAQKAIATSSGSLPPNSNRWNELTTREQEILRLIAQGASNREIAQQLFISEKTVRNHVTNILNRLGLRDRTQAAIFYHSS